MSYLFNDFGEHSYAVFSDCGKYRYALWRFWDAHKPLLMVVGLNPSTANAETDDPTIRNVKKIAFNNGFGGVYMMNCFAYISTNPNDLMDMEFSEDNKTWLNRIRVKCSAVCFAWGSFDIVRRSGVGDKMFDMFPDVFALRINKNGSPKHPLYCKGDTKIVKYSKSDWANEKNR